MADNTSLNVMSGGDTISTDDIAGVKVQRMKVQHGADGSATDVSTASPLPVTLANTGANATAVKTDGSAVTQPVSAASLPLPTGAATEATLSALNTKVPASPATAGAQATANTSLASIDGKITAVNTGAVVVSSSALPTGASTSAKQPALGTAGTASTDVLTVQGIASMTALKVDGSATTQPVSGTVTANATLAAETTKVIGVTRTADGSGNLITSTTNALDVNIKSGASSGAVAQGSTTSGQTGSLVQGAVTTAAPSYTTAQTSPLSLTTAGALRTDASATTQPVSGTVTANAGTGTMAVSAASLPLPSGASSAAKQPALGTAGTPSADVITVQGATSMTALKVDPSGVTSPVSLASVPSHAVTNAGTFAVQSTLQTQTDTVMIGGVNVKEINAVAPLMGNGVTGTGSQRVTVASDNTPFTVNAAQSGTWTVQPGNTANTTAWKVDGSAVTQPVSLASVPSHAVTNAGTFATQATAATTGGYTPSKLISAASTNATSIKASAGTLGYITASNVNAAARYLKIYNKASAPTVGTDVPVHTFLIPGNTAGAGTNIPLPPQGIALGTGIAIAITTGVADADTGAVAASEVVVNYGTA